MNRIEFYTKLNKAKDEVRKKQLEHSSTQNNYNSWFIKVDDYYGINQPRYFTKEEFDELRHSNEYGKQHYAKIENYYPDGRTRYFWSKEEWDAYQKNKGQDVYRMQQEIAKKASENLVENTANRWAKNNSVKIAANAAATNDVDEIKKEVRKIEYKNRNEAATKALEKAEKEKWDALRKQNNPEPKLESTAKTRKEKWKKEGEKNILPSRKKLDQYTEELTKLQGQMNLIKNRKFSQKDDKQKYNELVKAINEKEQQIKNAKESLAKEREANYKKNMTSQEKAMKEGQKTTIEENRKLKESIEKQKEEELNNWKNERSDEVHAAKKQIENAIEACYKDRHTSFNINNEYTDLLKELLSKADPDFEDKYEGSIAKYVMPSFEATGWMKEHDMDPFRNDERKKIVDETLEGLQKMILNNIESTTVEDEKYDSYLNKLKKQKKEKTDKAITKDINTARLSLKKMYDGDSKNLDLDPSLMKALNDKLAQMDEEYNGNLYKYVRPYLFNTWIKDDDSYDTVKKALDEIEKELRTANKNNEDYGEYIDKVSKILEA